MHVARAFLCHRFARQLVALLVLLTGAVAPGCQRAARGLPDAPSPSADRGDAVARPAPPTTERELFDIAYSSRSATHKLDVYLPAGEGPHPVIVFVHGGGYVAGDKRDGQEAAVLQARKRGYAVVSINYRLIQEADFPAQVHDVKAAVRWVRANAGRYRFDPKRVALWGGSAGAHLALLGGLSSNRDGLDDPTLGNASQSNRVQAVVDWFGPVDFRLMHRQLEARSATETQTAGLRHLSRMLAESPGLVDAANPIQHLSADDPPVFIQHGDYDPVVPVIHSHLLADAILERYGARKVKLSVLAGGGHGGPVFRSARNIDLILNFLDDSLGR